MRFPLLRRAALAGAVITAVALAGAPPAHAAGTGTITGRLTTSAGTPAADVPVQVYDADTYNSPGWATTDADGRYTITGLAPKAYIVGFFPTGGAQQFYRQQSEVWQADAVTVVSGQTVTADDQLRATGVITGQIRDGAGNPASSLLVRVVNNDSGDQVYGSTDGEGRYRLDALPGWYTISFDPIEGSYQSQYVPGKLDSESAQRFEVRAGAEVVADDTVLPIGSLAGRFTSAAGEPLANVTVSATTPNWYGSAPDAATDANGQFAMPALLAGAYKVAFYHGERQQYYRGKLDQADAELVVVHGEQTTRISDKLLGTGSVRVSAVDAVTGAPLATFCVKAVCSKGTGQVTIDDLPQGQHDLYVDVPNALHFSKEITGVRVRAGQTTERTVLLKPAAAITTTIVDRRTGQPVKDVCVDAFLPKQASLRDGHGRCSDRNGKITIGPLEGGSYRLFAIPQDVAYGRQWVGADGGTGDERQAAPVAATAGKAAAAPQVKLDPAGSLTGRVTDAASGAPIQSAGIALLTGHPGVGVGDEVTDADGRYRIGRLGPYEWPLGFGAHDYAQQWSGGAVSRFTATPIAVTAGGTATHDIALSAGTEVTGSFNNQDGTAFAGGWVLAHNAETGDVAGAGWMSDGQFRMRVLGKQRIYVTYNVSFRDGQDWYDDRYLATQPDGSRKLAIFVVPATGTLAVNLVVQTG
ncbi:carboxypeptidase-like regulatory domain-containing protein [Micromonospora sp. NPDC049679]|uniref:carboxypeptidase-like regulatory domain-containing protein n=1 Tax=Micromonospora sp. NPDC049679 TaxID=3155920 RepID=UPI003408B48D